MDNKNGWIGVILIFDWITRESFASSFVAEILKLSLRLLPMDDDAKQNLNFSASDTKTSKKKDFSRSQSTVRPIRSNQLTSPSKEWTIFWPKSMTLRESTIRWSTEKSPISILTFQELYFYTFLFQV